MLHLNNIAPILAGLTLAWLVVLGTRELFKEASVIVLKKTTS